MKRNVLFIMVVTLGALFVFTTYGNCGSDMRPSETRLISSDPHDEDFGIAASARQNTVETTYTIGDPHKNLDVAIIRKSKIVRAAYISGDPHDNENSEMLPPVLRRPVIIDNISDPH